MFSNKISLEGFIFFKSCLCFGAHFTQYVELGPILAPQSKHVLVSFLFFLAL